MDNDELPKPKREHVVGENLDTISVDELKLRVGILTAEIVRLEAEIVKKQSSKSAADAFFRS
jgi:uncharacterized small protein (DUF1192 family)